ncbi:MAG: hypothetical protein EXR49_00010 [Dehalococcoidia bacterium]|nr:hypothetical protein [Dehalococcoidia bacterium]
MPEKTGNRTIAARPPALVGGFLAGLAISIWWALAIGAWEAARDPGAVSETIERQLLLNLGAPCGGAIVLGILKAASPQRLFTQPPS